ncbi:hypothetical protein [Kitasatospora acidiphila]|uniref:hypothetical protein n=1 Tax=Kitasatospora acidiphila TaxID=2567942 RepID=UPI003C7536CE
MDGSIRSLTCDYLARGVEPAAAAAHLDQLARLELPGILSTLLDSVYGDDPAVYVIRQVHAEFALRADAPTAARRWAEALARAIVTAVAADASADGNVIRFADQAEYLAAYLVEHLGGTAAQHWYFHPFAAWHAEPTGSAARALLATQPPVPVLAALHRQAMLPALLATLPDAAIRELAADTTRPPAPADDVSGLWPLLTTAVAIADAWGLWTGVPLAALDVARVYRSRAVPDWRSPTALTLVVVDVLRRLSARGDLRTPTAPPPAELADRFDWLEVDLLLPGLTAASPKPAGRREAAVRQALADVLAASPELRAAVRVAGPGPRAALLLRAALVAERPEWADDGFVVAVLAEVQDRWAAGEADPVLAQLAGPLADQLAGRTDADVEDSPFAGLLLLLRAVTELRVPAVLARAGLADFLPEILLAVACRLTGADSAEPAVRAFAGRPAQVRRGWRQVHHLAALRGELLVQAGAQRLPDPAELTELADTDLPDGKLGRPKADAVIGLLAGAVLRAWSRWLGQFSESSGGYLLAHFVRRPGRLHWTAEELVVELEPGPLDVVVSMAGYDRPLEAVPWLGGRTVRYRMGAS